MSNHRIGWVVGLFMATFLVPCHATEPKLEFKPAQPGYVYRFPKDHGSHEAYQTEWWYYTGHLAAPDGRWYGYQLTFFRSGMDHPSLIENPSRWAIRHLYLAHFAITDENGKRFFYSEKVNRAGIENAGAKTEDLQVWNGHWKASLDGSDHRLVASEGDWAIDLWLTPGKPAVSHGANGISKKGGGPTQASHYYSFTRMDTRGAIVVNGHRLKVKGTSWMDHEFGSNQLSQDQVGWDWFGLQLENGIELMLYQIRKKEGGVDPFSGGTIILRDGSSRHLAIHEFQVTPHDFWQSPKSRANYPSAWEITLPDQDIILTVTPTVSDQELITSMSTGITYWEGSVDIHGTYQGRPITGKGYAELTGYAGAMQRQF